MPATHSLDELITRKAAEFADQLRKAAAMADKEEEIRIESERQLAFIEREAGVKLEGRHEFTIARGRVDSFYTRVLVEYKNPSSPSDRIGDRPETPGCKAVVQQIQSRFRGLKDEHGQPLNNLFGVGLDGNHFVFVRFRDKKWDVQGPVEVNRVSAERFLWALFNLGQKGKPFLPEYLAGDFGAQEGSLATAGVRALYDAIVAATHPKPQTFFKQWKILFGEVCGYDVDNPSDKVKKLAQTYGIPLKGFQPADLLFALHSYYALFMKLLASEIVAFFHKGITRLRSQVQKILNAPTSEKLKREMEELEAGSIFRTLNITNFLEGDLFAWYTSVWSEPIEKLVRDMAARLDNYNPGTLSEDPANSRDLLKRLYQQLFPKSVRHDLGEYYTPDWLADHVLNEVGYTGDPDKRLLDPACGSGTFLVMAINRIKKWFEENRERAGYEEGDLCRKVLANVVGFDLNPLAVMAARTNYLIAVRDLVSHVDRIEIPVYLCDSIMTPSEHGGLFAGALDKSRRLKTAAATFDIPTEIATSREDVAKYAEQLEHGVRNGYSSQEFLERCAEEGLAVSSKPLHRELFEELVRLDKANKNGVWARIIKNAFAPLFIGRVDYVVGNPPWVNWESLPKEYRDTTVSLWDKYRLRERATAGARLGNVKRELSVLFVYVALDHYVTKRGRLGYVITQSIFKSGANEGFRRFAIRSDQPFRVTSVTDMSLFLPFENAINRTAVMIAERSQKTRYPVNYFLWAPAEPRSQVSEGSLDAVRETVVEHKWLAAPVEPSVPESTWLTAPKNALPPLQTIIGDRNAKVMDRSFAGSCTWLNGVYWVEQIKPGERSSVIRNLGEVGRNKVDTVEARVENDFLFPLLRGRDVKAWCARPSATIIVPHVRENFGEPVPLATMKRKYSLVFNYFKRFEDRLRQRSGYVQLHRSRSEFYVVGNVGDYSLARYKVIFKDLTEWFQCAVVDPGDTFKTAPVPVIADHTLLFMTCGTAEEAYFTAGMLNSCTARVALYCASVGVQTQRYFPTDVSRVRMPPFSNKNKDHALIVKLSKRCHTIAEADGDLADAEAELAGAVAAVQGLTPKELASLTAVYRDIQTFRSRRPTEDE
jgi:hypothetical protein